MNNMSHKELHDLMFNILPRLNLEYEAAKAEESRARSKATDALNRLNGAQKEIDKQIEQLKGKAPSGSDWS